jgi:hypothetical protein
MIFPTIISLALISSALGAYPATVVIPTNPYIVPRIPPSCPIMSPDYTLDFRASELSDTQRHDWLTAFTCAKRILFQLSGYVQRVEFSEKEFRSPNPNFYGKTISSGETLRLINAALNSFRLDITLDNRMMLARYQEYRVTMNDDPLLYVTLPLNITDHFHVAAFTALQMLLKFNGCHKFETSVISELSFQMIRVNFPLYQFMAPIRIPVQHRESEFSNAEIEALKVVKMVPDPSGYRPTRQFSEMFSQVHPKRPRSGRNRNTPSPVSAETIEIPGFQ